MQAVDQQTNQATAEVHEAWKVSRVPRIVWWTADCTAVGLLLGLIAVIGWVRLWREKVFADWDVVTFYLPWYASMGERLRQFDVPGWNPHVFSGMPFAADPQSGWGYLPAMVFFAVFPPLTAYKLFVLFHLLLAVVGAYAFVRLLGFRALASFAGAVTFTFGGTLGAQNCCTIHLQMVVWVPVGLIGVEMATRALTWHHRLLALSLSGLAVSQILAAWFGQGAYYALLVIGSYLVIRTAIIPPIDSPSYRQRAFNVAINGAILLAIGFGLGAAALLPRLDHVGRTFVGSAAYQGDSCGEYCGSDWWSILRKTMSFTAWWFPYYIGGATLACASFGALTAKHRRIVIYFLALTVVVLVLPMHAASIHRVFYALPRFVGLHAHDPSRVLALLPVGLAILVAAAVEEFPRISRAPWALAIPFGLRAVWWFFVLSVPVTTWRVAEFTGHAFLVVSLVAAVGAILGTRWFRDAKLSLVISQRVLPVLVVLCILWDPAGHLVIETIRHPSTNAQAAEAIVASASSQESGGAGEFLQQKSASGEEFRYFGYVSPPSANWQAHEHYEDLVPLLVNSRSMLLGLEDVQGYNPVHLLSYRDFFGALNGTSREYHEEHVYPSGLDSPLLDLLNVRYIIIPSTALTDPARDNLHHLKTKWRPVFTNAEIQVLENPNALPRAWIVHSIAQVSASGARNLLACGEINPRTKALVEEEPPTFRRPPAGSTESVTITSHEADQITLSVQAASDGMVILSEVYDPGWRAYVDGNRVKIYQTDSILRGISVPASVHEVVLRYEPPALRYGMIITTLTFLAVLAVLGWSIVPWLRRRGDSRP